jgi:hypothetical protein
VQYSPAAQSSSMKQCQPIGHFVGQGPPQSGSDSPWFMYPSVHVGAHVSVIGSHNPPRQSASIKQGFNGGHLFTHDPPQS